jgi:TIR domain
MAVVSGHDYDVFISYAHFDNSDAWVTQFFDQLHKDLTRKVANQRNLSIAFDRSADRGFGVLSDDISKKVRGSAFFLFLLSQSSIQSDWCFEEFELFHSTHADAGKRVLIIELDNLLSNATFLKALTPHPRRTAILHKIIHYKRRYFWRQASPSAAVDQLNLRTSALEYLKEMNELVRDLSTAINAAIGNEPPPPPEEMHELARDLSTKIHAAVGNEPPPLPEERVRMVFAACPAELEPRRRRIVRALSSLPWLDVDTIDAQSIDASAFVRLAHQRIESCDLYLQVVGATEQPGADDIPLKLLETQIEHARSKGKKLMLWRSLDILDEDMVDTDREICRRYDVRAQTVSDFVASVAAEAMRIAEAKASARKQRRVAGDPRVGSGPAARGEFGSEGPVDILVCLNPDPQQSEIVKSYPDKVLAHVPAHAMTPPLDDRELLRQGFLDSDASLVVHFDPNNPRFGSAAISEFLKITSQKKGRSLIRLFKGTKIPVQNFQLRPNVDFRIILADRPDDYEKLEPFVKELRALRGGGRE